VTAVWGMRAPGADRPGPGVCLAEDGAHIAFVTFVYGDPDNPQRICPLHLLRKADVAWRKWLDERTGGGDKPA
jgi:hypothetical protein